MIVESKMSVSDGDARTSRSLSLRLVFAQPAVCLLATGNGSWLFSQLGTRGKFESPCTGIMTYPRPGPELHDQIAALFLDPEPQSPGRERLAPTFRLCCQLNLGHNGMIQESGS